MLCWLDICKYGFRANNHGLNLHLCIILAFLLFKCGQHNDNENCGTKETGGGSPDGRRALKGLRLIRRLRKETSTPFNRSISSPVPFTPPASSIFRGAARQLGGRPPPAPRPKLRQVPSSSSVLLLGLRWTLKRRRAPPDALVPGSGGSASGFDGSSLSLFPAGL